MRLEKFGFIYQKFYLIDTLNVYDNIILPALALRTNFDKEYTDELCEILKIESKKELLSIAVIWGRTTKSVYCKSIN